MSEEEVLRIAVVAILGSAIGISGWHRRRARIEGGTISRSQESPFLILLRIVATLPILATVLAFVVHPPWMAFSQLALPRWLRWTGVASGVLAVPLVFWVVKSLGRNISETVLTKRDHRLVTEGPYRWVRHPLYGVGLLLLLGLSLITASWLLAAVTLLAALLILTVIIPREESALIETFGARYTEYQRRTGRILPIRPS